MAAASSSTSSDAVLVLDDCDCAECGQAIPVETARLQCPACMLSAHLDCSSRLFPAAGSGFEEAAYCRMCRGRQGGQASGSRVPQGQLDASPSPETGDFFDTSGSSCCVLCDQPVLDSSRKLLQCPACLLAVHSACMATGGGSSCDLFSASAHPPFCRLCAPQLQTPQQQEPPKQQHRSGQKRPGDGAEATPAKRSSQQPPPPSGTAGVIELDDEEPGSPAAAASAAEGGESEAAGEILTCVACEEAILRLATDGVQCPSCLLACHVGNACSQELFPRPPLCRMCEAARVTPARADENREECPMCLAPMPDEVATPDCCPHHRFCPPCLRNWAAKTRICPLDRRPFRQLLLRPRLGPDTAVLAVEQATGSTNANTWRAC